MTKLKKNEFNEKYRFRKPRIESVSCITCNYKTGGDNDENPAFCEHEERFRRIKLGKYWETYWRMPGKPTSHNIAKNCVCDAYSTDPLPEDFGVLELPEKHVIYLNSERGDSIVHADPSCPYVKVELLRVAMEGESYNLGVKVNDFSLRVPGSTVGDICDMPCCESKLPYQISRRSHYRETNGLKPDGTEPTKWVRNSLIPHDTKVSMSPDEAIKVFDFEGFDFGERRNVHSQISAVADHLHDKCNRLGTRSLSEAVNPIWCTYSFRFFDESLIGPDSHADFWVYHDDLFDAKKGLEQSLTDLENIPEGIIPVMDPHHVLGHAIRVCGPVVDKVWTGNRYSIAGVLRELEDEVLLSKGLTHFIELGAASFHGWEHIWGEFAIGFGEKASFHQK